MATAAPPDTLTEDLAAGTPAPGRRAHDRLLSIVVLVAAASPLVAAAVRNLANGWIPVGDNAYFTVRSRDVFTQHNPLLGAWSSGSAAVDTFVNNLGPLQLQLLAPFTKIGPAAGTIVGVTVTNLAAIAGIAYIAKRLSGVGGLALAMAVTASVTWSMGSQMLIESRQHSAMMLPFLCYLFAVWALTSGATWALWIGVISGSLTLQTHLSYAMLVPLLAIPAVAGLILVGRRNGRDPDRRRHVLVAALTGLAVWAHPLWDQLFGSQNMTEILSAGGDGSAPGLDVGGRLIARVLSLPPFWGRNSYSNYDPEEALPGATASWISLTVLTAALALGGVAAWRAGRRSAVAGPAVAVAGIVGALATALQLPVSDFGLSIGNYRWLWPLGAFCLFALVTSAAAAVPTSRIHPMRVLAVVGAAATVLLAALNIPYSYQARGEASYWPRIEITKALTSQLSDADIEGPVLIDRSNGYFGEPYTFATLVELQSLSVEFDFADDNEIYRWGDGRRPDSDATLMTFAYHDDARRTPPGATRVAFADGLEPGEARELNRLEPTVVEAFRTGDLDVDVASARKATGKPFKVLTSMMDGADVSSGFLLFDVRDLTSDGWVSGSEADLAVLARWQELREAQYEAVAIYLTPIDREG